MGFDDVGLRRLLLRVKAVTRTAATNCGCADSGWRLNSPELAQTWYTATGIPLLSTTETASPLCGGTEARPALARGLTELGIKQIMKDSLTRAWLDYLLSKGHACALTQKDENIRPHPGAKLYIHTKSFTGNK